ncbi:MAG: Rv3235 family protein [Ancrocorticia sp.]
MNALPDLRQPLVRPASPRVPSPDAAPLRASRPPHVNLVPIPDDGDTIPQGSHDFPRTSPDKPWDRLAFSFQQEKVVSVDHDDDVPDDSSPQGCALSSGALAQIIVHSIEILLGHRPPTHLRNWLNPRVYEALTRRAGLAIRISGRAPRSKPPRVLRVLRSHPDERVVEAAIVVHDGQKVRAAALRAEFARGRWRIVALEIG